AETQRLEALKRRATEHAAYRGQLEAALAENKLIEVALQREKEASEHAKRRAELEAELAQNKQAQSKLRQELEPAKKQLDDKKDQKANAGKLGAHTKELQAAHAEVEKEAKRLTEKLSEETRRREDAEQQALEIGRRRSELEAELGQLQEQLQ